MNRTDFEAFLMRAIVIVEQPNFFRAPDGGVLIELDERISPVKSWYARASLNGLFDRTFSRVVLTQTAARRVLRELEAAADRLQLPPPPEK